MNGFFQSLWQNLRTFPRTVADGLRPGVGDGDGSPKRMRRNFLYHLHPIRVTERALQPLTTLGLGVITATLFGVLCATGVLLMIYYVPTTREAYGSLQDIQYAVSFGAFVRALHRWASHAMVISVAMHLVRVLAMACYRRRELNWLLGIGLLGLTLGLAFTGYLLPWDQLSFWAVSVASAMFDSIPLLGRGLKTLLLGGDQLSQATLLRFYMLHIALLPALLLILVAFHLWRVRKDGGLAVSAAGVEGAGAAETAERPTVPAWPHLVLREAILVVAVLVVLALISLWVQAPLGAPADLHTPQNPEKAPWYFLWVQEMVSYSAPVGAFWFPCGLLLVLLLLPYLEREEAGIGRWFGTAACRKAAALSAGVATLAFVLLAAGHIGGGAATVPGAGWPDLLNPAAGMLLLAALAFLGCGVWARSTRAAFLAALIVLLVAVVGCTLLGLCRGPDWVFYWPWEEWPLVA